MDPTATREQGFVWIERSKWQIVKWWIARIVLFRWLVGCDGDGFKRDASGKAHVCHRIGCH
jgi:hypothetical protein